MIICLSCIVLYKCKYRLKLFNYLVERKVIKMLFNVHVQYKSKSKNGILRFK